MEELQKEYKIKDINSDTISVEDNQKIYNYITRLCSSFLIKYEKKIEQFELYTLRLNSIFSNILLNTQLLLKEYEKNSEYKTKINLQSQMQYLISDMYKLSEELKTKELKLELKKSAKLFDDTFTKKDIEILEKLNSLKKTNEQEIKKLTDDQYNIYNVIQKDEEDVINLIIPVFKFVFENDILQSSIYSLIEKYQIDYEKDLFINEELFKKTIKLKCFDVMSYEFTIGKLTDLINYCYELDLEEKIKFNIKQTKLFKYFYRLEKFEKIIKNKKYKGILEKETNIFINNFFETKIYIHNDNMIVDTSTLIKSLETAKHNILSKMGWSKDE